MTVPSPTVPRGPLVWAGIGSALVLTMAASAAVQQSLGVLGPFLLPRYDIGRVEFGLIGTGLALMGGAASPAVGRLVGRVGGRRLLAAPFLLSAGAFLLLAAGRAPGWLFAVVFVGGFAMACANPVTNDLVVEAVAPSRRGLLTGIKQSGVQVATVLAGLIIPSSVLAFGWTAMALGVAGGLIVLALLAVAMTRPVTRQEGRATGVARPPISDSHRVLARRLAIASALVGAVVSSLYTYIPLYAVEGVGFSVRAAGLASVLLGVVTIVSRVVWGWRLDRLADPRRPLSSLLFLALPGMVLIAAARPATAFLLLLGLALVGCTLVAWNTVVMLNLVQTLPPASVGAASGSVQLGFYIGLASGPPLFAWTVEISSYTAGFGLLSAVTVAAAVAMTDRRGSAAMST